MILLVLVVVLARSALPALMSNVILVDLLPNLMPLHLQPEDLLGWTNRSSSLPFPAKSSVQETLDKVQTRRTRAEILALIGELVPAEQLLQTISPSDILARSWLTFVYHQQHRPAEAIEILQSVPQMAIYFAQSGFQAAQKEDFARAMRLWEASTEFKMDDSQLRGEVFEKLSRTAYYQLGDIEHAVRWGARWLEFSPGDTNGRIWLASLYLWNDSPEEAAGVLERGTFYGVQNSRFYLGQMGRVYQARGQWDLAIQSYRASLEQNKDDPNMVPDLAWYLGVALCHEQHCQEARPYLEIAVKTGPSTLQQQAARLLAQIDAQKLP